ncbi:MAG: tetratricopeptide repeat protein [Candidatus Helarchaeota archaeon]
MEFDIEKLEKIAEGHLEAEDYLGCAQTLSLIVDFFEKINNEKKSHFYYQQILECYKKSAQQDNIDFMEAAERWCGAACLAKILNMNDYISCVNKMVTSIESAAIESIKKKDYLEAAEYYQQAGKYIKDELNDIKFKDLFRKAIECYEKILVDNIISINEDQKIKFYLRIAQLYDELDEYENAINFHNQAIQIFNANKPKNSYSLLAKIYHYKANCLQKSSNEQEKAEELIKKAIQCLNTEAELNIKTKDYLKAAENLCLASNLCEKLNTIYYDYNNILEKEAKCYLNFAEKLISNGNNVQAAKFERDAAFCYYKLQVPEKAINLLLKSAQKLEKEKDYLSAAENYRDASLVFKHLNDYSNCGKYAYKGGLIAKLGDFNFLAIDNFKTAYNCYFKLKDIELINNTCKELIECLVKVAELESKDKNYHLGGTYFFNATQYVVNDEYKKDLLEKSLNAYLNAIDVAIEDSNHFIASYSLCCAGFIMILLNRTHKIEQIIEKYHILNNEKYITLLKRIIECIDKSSNNISQELHQIKHEFHKLIKNSDEIKGFLLLIDHKVS